MKKQINRSTKGFLFFPLMMFLLGMTTTEIQAQTFTVTDEKDIVVPSDQAKMYVELQGGDGGRNIYAQGGRGATIRGILNIGTATGMIKPGGTLRFIAGAAGGGSSSKENGFKGGAGGGASGLVYKAPGSSQWDIIAVAGGGGGASMYLDDNAKYHGHDGGQGKANIANMVETASGYLENAKGGSPHYGTTENSYSCVGRAGTVDGQPVRVGKYLACGAFSGGAGFGSGASYVSIVAADRKSTNWYGGGGGGYYGGDHHASLYDNGGGSWMNATYLTTVKAYANGVTESPQNGYITYSYDMGPIKFAYNTNKCIDDYGSGTSNGNNILSYSCTGNPNQQWVVNTSDRTIHSMVDFGKCLDLSNGNTGNGTNIQLWDCMSGNANQFWVYNGIYKTIHSGKNSEKCFDAANGSAFPNSNVNIQLWDCQYTNNNQKWVIEGATTVSNPGSARRIIPVLAQNFAVASALGNEWGSNIQLWTKDQTLWSEYWYFDGLEIKLREFREFCIDLHDSNTDNGNNIQLWGCNGTNAQKWIYDGMTKSIRSVINPAKCMQIEKNNDGVYGKRSNIDIRDCDGSAAQQFLILEQ